MRRMPVGVVARARWAFRSAALVLEQPGPESVHPLFAHARFRYFGEPPAPPAGLNPALFGQRVAHVEAIRTR